LQVQTLKPIAARKKEQRRKVCLRQAGLATKSQSHPARHAKISRNLIATLAGKVLPKYRTKNQRSNHTRGTADGREWPLPGHLEP